VSSSPLTPAPSRSTRAPTTRPAGFRADCTGSGGAAVSVGTRTRGCLSTRLTGAGARGQQSVATDSGPSFRQSSAGLGLQCSRVVRRRSLRPLPPLPEIRLAVMRDRTAESRAAGGFMDVRRLDLVARYPDAGESAPFAYDVAARSALDAVVIAAWF